MVTHERLQQSNFDKQIAKEIIIAYIQAGGAGSHLSLFPKNDRDSVASKPFEAVWEAIIKTVSALAPDSINQ